MKKLAFIVLLLNSIVAMAADKILVCSLAGIKDKLSFTIPSKEENLPVIEFPYAVKAIVFSMREANLLLIAMDQEEPTRPRIFISGQLDKNDKSYRGQFMTDFGGNQKQLDNGPVTCKLQ